MPSTDVLMPGDYVSVNADGRLVEGTVVGSNYDYAGRQIIQVRLNQGEYYSTWAPYASRVRKTTTYYPAKSPGQWVERHVYW